MRHSRGLAERNPAEWVERTRVDAASRRAGLSKAEAVDGLGRSDDGDRTLAVVRKGGHPDVVIIERVDWSVIERYLAERPAGPQGWLFATAGGRQMSRQTAYRLVREVADQVTGDRKKIGPHSLRHTFATLALDEGLPIQEVQGRYVTCPRLRHSTRVSRRTEPRTGAPSR